MRALSGLLVPAGGCGQAGMSSLTHAHACVALPQLLPHVDVEVCGRSSEPCWGCRQPQGAWASVPSPSPAALLLRKTLSNSA